MQNVIDSSVWIEYLRSGSDDESLVRAMDATERLVVPSITLLEIRKWTIRNALRTAGVDLLGWMMNGKVVDLTADLAFEVATVSLEHKLPLADSVIYATARRHEAVLWTRDKHFSGLPDVRMLA
jgi:predicted nucleic acid-binding protein